MDNEYIDNLSYNPLAESLVNILMVKTQNFSPQFFRLQTNFYLTLVASAMNIKIKSNITGTLPINFYGINLAVSGSGKGYSTTILENTVLKAFHDHFMMEIFPKRAELSIELEAIRRANVSSTLSLDEIKTKLEKEYKSYGAYSFSFDKATAPALKQLRNKLLLAKVGSLNLITDEIGYNLQANSEALVALLELYDKGLIKNKLVKNTEASTRFKELRGSTPANALLFGTPTTLLNGGKTEDEYFNLLESGYARRCFFAFTPKTKPVTQVPPEELYDTLSQQTNDATLNNISQKLFNLADLNLVGLELELPRDVGIKLIEYRQFCESRAAEMPLFAEVQRSEMTHRYFKALKLAGTYAFIDNDIEIRETHLNQAIKFTEESGLAMERMFKREKPYERLAKYIADNQGNELTQVDISNDLPFYKGGQSYKNEMMNMAIAYGYKNNIIIKKVFRDGIEFFSGETLKENSLDAMVVAYSQHYSEGYLNEKISWDKLPTLLTSAGYHWVNHHSLNGNRSNQDMKQGFNMLVLDIDKDVSIATVQSLMTDYEYIIQTTKRHQKINPETGENFGDRFRLIFPTNYEVKLSETDFKEFMKNIAKFLPFNGLDLQTFQRSRKWECNADATIISNSGELFDVLPFIPKTSRAENHNKTQLSYANLDQLEKWFAQRMVAGNRNNQLANFGFMLMDNGFTDQEIEQRILDFNSKLDNGLAEEEILTTIMTSIRNRLNNNSQE